MEPNDQIDHSIIQAILELLTNTSKGIFSQLTPDNHYPDVLQQLIQEINCISEMLKDLEAYTLALSKGHLDVIPPSRKNYLAAGVKNLHAQLNHVTWQAQQVSQGDYDQVVDFMGEFSRAFNTMTQMLKKREQASRERRKSLMHIFNNLHIIIIVLDRENKSFLFLNNAAIQYSQELIALGCQQRSEDSFVSMILKNLPESNDASFFCDIYSQKWLKLESTSIQWQDDKEAILCTLLDVTQIKQQEDTLRTAAEKDVLTGTYRREAGVALFYNRMKTSHQNRPYVVCFADMDGLKGINDNFGHSAGDTAIRAVADTLKYCLRDSDIIMRVGGDELVFILVGCDDQRALDIKQRISNKLEEYNQENCHPFKVAVSIGLSKSSTDYLEFETLLKTADAMMYQAKQKKKLST